MIALALLACGAKLQEDGPRGFRQGEGSRPDTVITSASPTDDPTEGAGCPGLSGGELRLDETVSGASPDRESEAYFCPAVNGAEVHYPFTAPVDADYTFTADLPEGAGLGLAADCDHPVGCLDGPILTLPMFAGESVVLVVDGPPAPHGLRVTASVEVACDDGEDGDGDGAVDCDDPDCPRVGPCALACTDATLEAGVWTDGRTGDVLRGADPPGCAYGEARGWVFTAPEAGDWTFGAGGRSHPILAVGLGCRGRWLGCGPDDAQFPVALAAGESVLVVAAGAGLSFEVFASLATASETACDGDLDDDADGLVNCNDPDCDGSPDCVEDCDNGRDDDDDLRFDCGDPDCWDDPAC